jgi:type I restriction enzyme S subunit
MSAWPIVALEEVFEVARGGSPRPIDDFITDDPNGVNWIMIGDASEGSKYISSTKKRIIKEGVKKSRMVSAGDFLLTNSMSFGKPYILKTSGCIHDGWLVLSPRHDQIHPDFFYHLLGSDVVYSRFKKLAAGAVVKNLNSELVRGVEIPLPPLAEQKRIAAILDKADAIRSKLQQSIRLSDDFLRSVFLDMFGSDKSPKCERVPLGPFLEFMTSGGRGWSQYYAPSGARFIRSLDVQMNEIGEKDVAYVAAPNNAEAKRTRVQENDVLLTITGSLIGRVARIPKEHAGAYISQHVAILRLGKGLDPEFLARFLSMDEGQRLVQKSQYGQTKPGLNFDQIRRFKVPLPSVEFQRRFVAIANRLSTRQLKSRALMCDAEALFSSLQQRAFRGEL